MSAVVRLPSSVQPKDSGVLTNAVQWAETFLNSLLMSKSSLKLLRSPATCTSTAQHLAFAQQLPGRSPHFPKSLPLQSELTCWAKFSGFFKVKNLLYGYTIITKRKLPLHFYLNDMMFVNEALQEKPCTPDPTIRTPIQKTSGAFR